ncbi:hypothetical protein niasHS_018165 [Heterodera schachtii]|uniref:Ubiquitin-like domain-containing protein n=1 Tax=Heterodera schachtii TaxID=97005 RepID=A0ABD2HVJ3_HETSC
MRLTNKSDQITVKLKENETVKVLKGKIMEKLDKKIEKDIGHELNIYHPKPTLKYQQKSAADKDFVELEDDSKTLKDYGIGQNATVHLSFDKFEIFVEFQEKNQIQKNRLTVGVKKTDTVEALKRMIQTLTQIEPQRQTLRMDNCGAVLKDTETMANCNSKHIVYLAIDEFEIHVQLEYGNTKYTVWVHSMETVSIVKLKIRNQMIAYISSYKHIRANEQTLKYGTFGVLKDSETMAFYDIGAGTIVQLSLEEIYEIVVEYEKTEEQKEEKNEKKVEKFTFKVKKTNTIATLKNMIKKATKFVPKRQTLRRFSTYRTVLMDTEILAPTIQHEPTIYLSIDEFQIYVEYDNKKYNTIWVKGTETVAILKKKIEYGLNPSNYFNTVTQTLGYGTFAVLDDRKALNDYGILKDATVCLSISTFSIQVAHEDGKGRLHYHNIWVRESDTVKMLKQKIEIKLGFPPKKQSLRYVYKQNPYPAELYDDSKTMEDHAIEDRVTVQLKLKEFEICVFNGSQELRVAVNGDETVEDLKEEIKAWIGIPSKLKLKNKDGTEKVLKDELKIETKSWVGTPFKLKLKNKDGTETVLKDALKEETKAWVGTPFKLKLKNKDGTETVLKDASQTLAFYGIGGNDNNIYIEQAESAVVVVAPPTEEKAKPTKIRPL